MLDVIQYITDDNFFFHPVSAVIFYQYCQNEWLNEVFLNAAYPVYYRCLLRHAMLLSDLFVIWLNALKTP